MREINVNEVYAVVKELCQETNISLAEDILSSLRKSVDYEQSETGKKILKLMIDNAVTAKEKKMAICQDTGMVVIFLEIGQDVHFYGGDLLASVGKGVSDGYREGYFRPSVVSDPFKRENTGDNSPPVIYTSIIPGDKVVVTVAPKGFGSEHMSAVRMLTPADGLSGVKKFILEVVEKAGANPCPPVIVGVGIGGTMDYAALLAKKALLRPVNVWHENPEIAAIEKEVLELINNTGIGPQGLGGRCTALAVHILTYPTHIAGLPVAVNIGCHVTRHMTKVI